MISRVKKYSMENEWPGSPCLIRFGNRQECGYGKYNADGKYEPGEKNIRSFRRNFGMVALAAVAALSCVGADVVCAQTSSRDVRAASGQSVASGQDLESAGFIFTQPGRGSFVAAQNTAFIREEQLRLAEEHLQEAAQIGRRHGISYDQLAKILRLFYEE